MDITSILLDHQKRYPLWQIRDVYKLLHQAAMGSEHAVDDAAGVRAWMKRELKEMGEGPNEPLVDPISPDGSIVRVHLRPYVAQGGDPASLVDAFMRTAHEFRGSWVNLAQFANAALHLTALGKLPFSQVELAHFFDRMQHLDYPARHHSGEFEADYKPAYRVVHRSLLTIKEKKK